MSGCCSIRAIWILNAQEAVVFSRFVFFLFLQLDLLKFEFFSGGIGGFMIMDVFLLFLLLNRRFPVVEKRWRLACERENQKPGGYALRPLIPTDSKLAAAFSERKNRFSSFSSSIVHKLQL